MTVELCVICNKDVTEDDHRREIDCPNKYCPGRTYHEECIASYLKKTKYSKDRCTGFPCPAVMSNEKPCPGYVCKMHTYFPSNQKKKQARLDAAVGAAAITAAATKAARNPAAAGKPPKAPTAAQVAIAAIKRAAPEGTPVPAPAKVTRPPAPAPGGAARLAVQAPAPPRIIPGLHPPDREQLRATITKLREEARAPAGGGKGGAQQQARAGAGAAAAAPAKLGGWGVVVAVGGGGGGKQLDERQPQQATLWDAFSRAPGFGNELNMFELEQRAGGSAGKFSKMLRKRLEGSSGGGIPEPDPNTDDAVSDSDSVGTDVSSIQTAFSGRAHRTAPPVLSPEHFPVLPPLPLLDSPTAPAASIEAFLEPTKPLPATYAADVDAAGVDADADPVQEYDILYGLEDGTYLVLDALSDKYFRLEDVYGPAPQLVEVCAEDGNSYMCVAVRASDLHARAERQRAWVESQMEGGDPQADAVQQHAVQQQAVQQAIQDEEAAQRLQWQYAAQQGTVLSASEMFAPPAPPAFAPAAAAPPPPAPSTWTDAKWASSGATAAGAGAAGYAQHAFGAAAPPEPAQADDDEEDMASLMNLLCV